MKVSSLLDTYFKYDIGKNNKVELYSKQLCYEKSIELSNILNNIFDENKELRECYKSDPYAEDCTDLDTFQNYINNIEIYFAINNNKKFNIHCKIFEECFDCEFRFVYDSNLPCLNSSESLICEIFKNYRNDNLELIKEYDETIPELINNISIEDGYKNIFLSIFNQIKLDEYTTDIDDMWEDYDMCNIRFEDVHDNNYVYCLADFINAIFEGNEDGIYEALLSVPIKKYRIKLTKEFYYIFYMDIFTGVIEYSYVESRFGNKLNDNDMSRELKNIINNIHSHEDINNFINQYITES